MSDALHPELRPTSWFDDYWEANKHRLPVFMRSNSTKEMARGIIENMIQGMAKHSATPDGIRALIAFGRIAAIVKGTQGVIDAPNPTPEQIADAVEKMAQRMKP